MGKKYKQMNYLNNDIQIIKRLLDYNKEKEAKEVVKMFTGGYIIRILAKLDPIDRQKLMDILYD